MTWMMIHGKKTKTKHMKWLKTLLFGERAKSLGPIKLGFHTVHPEHNKPFDYGDWCEEFRVSMMHGKQAIHLND
jgi:hypothetical protein